MQKGKQEGPFWKKGYKGWGFLIKMGEGEGLKGKIALFFLLPAQSRGGGVLGAGGGPRRRPRARRRPGSGGKREGAWGVDPPPNFRRGGRKEGATAMATAAGRWPWAARAGAARASARGEKGEGGPGHLPRPLARAGTWRSGPATGSRRGGGAGLRRWRCCVEEEGAWRWRWLWSWGAARGLFIGRVRWWGERWGGGREGGRPVSFAGVINDVWPLASIAGRCVGGEDDKTARACARGGGPAAVCE